ncbi:MAG: ABC transporter permease, partial [Nakamurella sp.]
PWAIVPICMLVCAVFGFVNGAGTALLRIQSFVMTLAMMTIARGIVRLASGSVSIGTIAINADGNPTQASQAFSQLGTPGTNVFGGAKVIGYFPVLALVAVVIIFQLILSKTKFGRHVYAVGGNPIAARLSGVKVVGVTIAVFTIGGMMAGIAGPINAAYNASADPQAGLGYELDAIAAVVIGGASLFGGRGSVIGTFVGSLILTLLDNVLGLNSVSDNWQMIIKGVIVVLAVVIQRPELFSDLASWVKRTFRRQPDVVGPDAAGLTAPAADAGGSDTVGITTKAADPTTADNGDQRPPNPEGGRA